MDAKRKDERRSLPTGSRKDRCTSGDAPTDSCFGGVTAKVAHQQAHPTQILRPIRPKSPWQALMVVHGEIWALLLRIREGKPGLMVRSDIQILSRTRLSVSHLISYIRMSHKEKGEMGQVARVLTSRT